MALELAMDYKSSPLDIVFDIRRYFDCVWLYLACSCMLVTNMASRWSSGGGCTYCVKCLSYLPWMYIFVIHLETFIISILVAIAPCPWSGTHAHVLIQGCVIYCNPEVLHHCEHEWAFHMGLQIVVILSTVLVFMYCSCEILGISGWNSHTGNEAGATLFSLSNTVNTTSKWIWDHPLYTF